jgi:hypothetical protein
MPKKDSDQRSYSVDEMMEKLKEGDREKRRAEESELVTRPDGSQVMRVRRRKRRSSQPVKTQQVRQRRYGIIALVTAVVLLVAAGALVLVLFARFNSKGYREEFKERLASTTGAKSGITDLSVTPFKVQAKSLQLVWPSGSMTKTLKLSDLEGDLEPTGFVGSQLKGREVAIEKGIMMVGPPSGTLVPSLPVGKFPVSFGAYRCSYFELFYGVEADSPSLHLRGTALTLRPKEEGGLRFTVSGGSLALGNWGELKIDNGLADLDDGRLTLISLHTRQGENGVAIFKGVKSIGPTGPAVFDVALENFSLAQMLGPTGLGRLLDGIVDVPAGSLSVDPRFDDSGQVKLQFTGQEGKVQGFQFLRLEGLSRVLDGRGYYLRPDGGQIDGLFTWDRDGMTLDKFRFEAKGIDPLIIEGKISISHVTRALSGSLKISVPATMMTRIREERGPDGETTSKTELRWPGFSMPDGRYCWIDFELGGTISQPTDSFSDQLQAAAVPELPAAEQDPVEE